MEIEILLMRNMKNEYKISLVIVLLAAITVFLAVASSTYLKQSSKELLGVCDSISEAISSENTALLQKNVGVLSSRWDSVKNIWFMLIDHSDIHKVEEFILDVKFYSRKLHTNEIERHLELLAAILEDIGMADSVSFLTVI